MTYQDNYRVGWGCCVALILMTLLVTPALAATNSPPTVPGSKVNDLNTKLAWVREELALAQIDVNKGIAEYYRLEHDLVYTNKALYKLFLEVKRLEQELLSKRTAFQEETMKTPEMREVTKQRMAAFANQKKLQDQEAFFLKQIKGEEKFQVPPVRSEGK